MKINGSLVFDASSASEIQNLRVQKFSTRPSFPTYTSSDAGRLAFATDTAVMYYGSPVQNDWVSVASGGNAADLQTEVDAIESALGSAVGSNGVFIPSALTGAAFATAPTSISDAIQQLANYANANNELSELDDVALTSLTNNQYLVYNSSTGKWFNKTLVAANITDVTATAAELNILHGATVSTTELNYVTGATSNIQAQLNTLQASDPVLLSLAASTADGIVVTSGNGDVIAKRTLVAPAAGFTITNPDGVAGNPTFVLANDLAAIEGLATTGYIVRTGDGTATTRSFTGVTGNTVITNGSGVASDTTIDLAPIVQGTTGTFSKVSLDGFGRVVGNTPVTTGDITALVDTTYVNVTGDTMSGNLVMSAGATVTGLPAPTSDTQAANKAYVDALQNGLSWKAAARAATTGNISIASAASGYDGVTLAQGDRVLVKSQTTASENGIYVFNGVGNPLTRAADMNDAAEFDGSAVFVREGTTLEGSGWTETATVTTVGTDTVAFSQFTGGALYTWGNGLSNDGNTINVNLGAGIAQLPSDEVGIDLFNTTTGALILTTTGTDRSVSTDATLALLTGGASGLAQSAAGLFIAPAGVTNAMLTNSTVGLNGDTGTSTLALGQTLQVIGTSSQGVMTSVAGQTVTITTADASASQKGVASFSADDFTITAGSVVIKTVDNNQLANSKITLTGTTGSDDVSLGETLSVVGAVDGIVSTAMGANSLAITVRDATASLKGVASFAAADFTVTAGAVTAVPKGIDSLTDVTVSGPSAGESLVYSTAATGFVNRKIYHTQAFSASSTWVVSHGLGQQFCVVTVGADNGAGGIEVVIPQSITFDSATQLTVTFNTSISGQVMVMGVSGL